MIFEISSLLKMKHSWPLFSLFSSFRQLTVDIFIIIFANDCVPLVLEATTLPFEPQPQDGQDAFKRHFSQNLLAKVIQPHNNEPLH